MKIRQQVPKPCEKKGQDNYLNSAICECLGPCDKLKGFLNPDSSGTKKFKSETHSSFEGCLDVEQFLINENLLRYESRETGGLEILFEGVEGIHNLNAEIFNYDYTDGIELYGPMSVGSLFLDNIGNQIVDKLDNDRNLAKGAFTDEGLFHILPAILGFSQSSANTISASAPTNLQDSFFQSLYARGEFENEIEDIQSLAHCLIHGIDSPQEMKRIWPRYTENRYQRLKKVIWAKVYKETPWWAKRFEKIWDKLSKAQTQALLLEWFYDEDEKPSQAENALKLGISEASYKDRLEWAYKKLEELYPEFERVKRRKASFNTGQLMAPLFKINSDGNKEEISIPVVKYKIMSSRQSSKIKKWAKQTTTDYLLWLDIYDQVNDED